MPKCLYCIEWTESERGWGQRPDGYTLHISKEIADEYINENWGNRDQSGPTPAVYSFPSTPFLVEATDEEYVQAEKEKSFWGKGSFRRTN